MTQQTIQEQVEGALQNVRQVGRRLDVLFSDYYPSSVCASRALSWLIKLGEEIETLEAQQALGETGDGDVS